MAQGPYAHIRTEQPVLFSFGLKCRAYKEKSLGIVAECILKKAQRVRLKMQLASEVKEMRR